MNQSPLRNEECPLYSKLECGGEFDLFYKKEGGFIKDCACCKLDIQSSINYINTITDNKENG